MATVIATILEDIIQQCEGKETFHTIQITYANNGYNVTIGCVNLVFESKIRMLETIDAYLEDPKDAYARYREVIMEEDGINFDAGPEPQYQAMISGNRIR